MTKFYAEGELDQNPDAEPVDLSKLKWSTPEEVAESLAQVNAGILRGAVTPAAAKAVASVAGQSLRAFSLSVAKEIAALKERLDARDAEARGAGKRTGIR